MKVNAEQKQAKEKHGSFVDSKRFTVLVKVNNNKQRVPFSFESTLEWPTFYESLLFSINESGLEKVKKHEQYNLSYDQCVETEKFAVILTESSYPDFIQCISSSTSGCICVDACRKPPETAPIFDIKSVARIHVDGRVQNLKSTNMSEKEVMAKLRSEKWDISVVKKLSVVEKELAFRKAVEECKEKKSCQKCKDDPCHDFVEVGDASSKDLCQNRSKLTHKEKALMFRKRSIVLSVFGNADLLLNPLYFQCPLCGSLISLGHFNDIIQKDDKVYLHIEKVHYLQKDSKHKGIAFVLLKRMEEYRERGHKCSTPMVMCCCEGKIHSVVDIKLPGIRVSPWSNQLEKISFPSISQCHSKDCIVVKDPRPINKDEFKILFKDFMPHFEVSQCNLAIFMQANTDITVVDCEDVEVSG